MTSEKVMHAFRFSDEDLEFNRKGSMSPNQVRQLRRARFRITVLSAAGGVFMLLIAFGLMLQDISLIFVMIMALVSFFYSAYSAWVYTQDIQLGAAVSASGQIALSTRVGTRQSRTRYNLHIRGAQMEVSGSQYQSLKNGGEYTVYYTPHAQVVLAIESPTYLHTSPSQNWKSPMRLSDDGELVFEDELHRTND
jgi:hypothetical protein